MTRKRSKKKRTIAQQLGELGQTEVRRIFERARWTVTGLDGGTDFGEDQLVRVFIGEEVTELLFFVQVKAFALASTEFSLRIKTTDLDIWQGITNPVFLVLWSEVNHQAYWLDVHSYVTKLNKRNPNWLKRKSHNIRFDEGMKLDQKSLEEMKQTIQDWYTKFAFNIRGQDALQIKFKFRFPKTPEGKQALERLQNHFKTGSGIELEGKYIQDIEFPNWYRRINQIPEMPETGMLRIEPKQSDKTFKARLQLRSKNEKVIINNLELKVTQGGSEEITLSDILQKDGLKIQVKINRFTKTTNITLGSRFSPSVSISLTNLKVVKLIREGCDFELSLLNDGSMLAKGHVQHPMQWDQRLLDLLEQLVLIENRFNVKLNLPVNGFRYSEQQRIERISKIAQAGIEEFVKPSAIKAQVKRSELKKFIKSFQTATGNISQISSENVVTVLGTKVNLGRIQYEFIGMQIPKVKEVLDEAGKTKKTETISVLIEPNEESKLRLIFLDLISQ